MTLYELLGKTWLLSRRKGFIECVSILQKNEARIVNENSRD